MLQLDLKKLSKNMGVNDKMRLLFQDSNRQAETSGKESVLTPQERKVIIEDAQNTGEIREIIKVHKLYIMATFIEIDLEIALLNLQLMITNIEKILIRILYKGELEDITGKISYHTSKESKIQEVIEKCLTDNVLLKDSNFFNPTENNNILEPNQDIQKVFMIAFQHAKKLKNKLHDMFYVTSKAPIDFLAEYTKKTIKESEEVLATFTNLDSTLKPLGIYRDFGQVFSNSTNLIEPHFLEVIKDLEKNLELSLEDKKALESTIDKSLNEDL